jgi:competence protein ComFA
VPELLFNLYMADGQDKAMLFLSSVPSFDRRFLQNEGYDSFVLITPPLPLGTAAKVYCELQKKINYRPGASEPLSVENARDKCRWLLRRIGVSISPVYSELGADSAVLEENILFNNDGMCVEPIPDHFPLPGHLEMQDVERLLKGRLLSLQEIAVFTGAADRNMLTRVLQSLCLKRRAVLLPALYTVQGDLVRCQRCGWEGYSEPHHCARCGSSVCCSCPECGMMGNLGFCSQLYTAYEGLATPRAADSGIGVIDGIRKLLKRDCSVERHQEICCSPLVWGAESVYAGLASEHEKRGQLYSGEKGAWGMASAEDEERRGSYSSLLGELRFTAPQESAVAALIEFGREGKAGGTFLVWAACGAGKTEVSFPLISETLGRGQQVLFASSRRDVVLEIAPRLARAFGEGRVTALYGGSGGHSKDVPLVVATTHQTLRFYRRFDLVILDEGDAYPYPGCRMLHFGVERARCDGGKLVYLTATPVPWMFAQTSKADIVKIPVRHHGFPLPVPKFLKISPWRRRRQGLRIQQRVLEIIGELLKKPGARIFIFVPTVALTSLVGEALRSAAGRAPLEHLKANGVEWTHASDRERALKRERFFAGEFPVLVTTTIMERGVTVPRVDVLVLEAGQEGVFDAPTLVQIAGRCGRSSDHPTGDVWFISSGVSRSMREARDQITGLNKEARRKGYLREK